MIPYVAFEDENEWDLAAKAFGSLPKLSKSSFKEDPKDVDATCQHAGWGTPQRDADGSPRVASKVNDWCAAMDGKTVSRQPGSDILFEMVPYSYYSYWLSAGNLYNAPSGSNYGDTSTISKDECVTSLISVMDSCDLNSGTTNGASLTGKCIQYVSTIPLVGDPSNIYW
jgi:hypothetical protein